MISLVPYAGILLICFIFLIGALLLRPAFYVFSNFSPFLGLLLAAVIISVCSFFAIFVIYFVQSIL